MAAIHRIRSQVACALPLHRPMGLVAAEFGKISLLPETPIVTNFLFCGRIYKIFTISIILSTKYLPFQSF